MTTLINAKPSTCRVLNNQEASNLNSEESGGIVAENPTYNLAALISNIKEEILQPTINEPVITTPTGIELKIIDRRSTVSRGS